MDGLSKLLCIDEDERLGHLTRLKDVFNEIEFLLWFAFHPKLLDLGQLELLWPDPDLLGILHDLTHPFLNTLILVVILWRIGG